MGQPYVAKRRWLESGRNLLELAQLVRRSPNTVRDALSGRFPGLKPATRAMYENVFQRYGLATDGLWERDASASRDPRRIPLAERAENPNPPAAKTASQPPEEPVLITREYLSQEDLDHFSLTNDPFDDQDVARSWTNPVTTFLERRVERAMLRRVIVAVVGEVGSGKTTLLRRLFQRLEAGPVRFCSPAAINRAQITDASLVHALLRDLGTGDPGYALSAEQRSQSLRELLVQLNIAGVVPVLVIDEAHDLPDSALVALKRIWDSYTTYRLLSVVLVGQLSLARRLKTTMGLRELTGRTDLYELPHMTPDEAHDYVRHRFSVVGEDAAMAFAPDAFAALREGLPTYPLWTNNLAVRAMRLARELGEGRVTREHIARV